MLLQIMCEQPVQVAAATDPNFTAPQAGGTVESEGAQKLQEREDIELETGNRGYVCI